MTTQDKLQIFHSHSEKEDEELAIQELFGNLNLSSDSITIIFISSLYNLEEIQESIRKHSKGKILGCTSSGEISSTGYQKHSISAISLCSRRLKEKTYLIKDVNEFGLENAEKISGDIQDQLEHYKRIVPSFEAFGLLLIDGLSIKEERIASNLHAANPTLPFIGGLCRG